MFHITTTTDGAVYTIALTGELDYQCSARLHQALTRLRLAAGDRLVLDLAELTFCDSSGLGAFIVAHELTSGAGAALDLLTPPAMLVRMLRTTGLAEIFTLRHTDQDQSIR